VHDWTLEVMMLERMRRSGREAAVLIEILTSDFLLAGQHPVGETHHIVAHRVAGIMLLNQRVGKPACAGGGQGKNPGHVPSLRNAVPVRDRQVRVIASERRRVRKKTDGFWAAAQ